MPAVQFTTIPCKPSIGNRHLEGHIFGEIRTCANNIVYARLKVFITFLFVFVSVFGVFVR